MTESKLLVQRIGLVALMNILSNLGGLVLLPILSKNMPVEDYGIWAQVTVTVGLASIVILLGLPHSMVRFMAATRERDDIRESFYSIFILVLMMGLLVSIPFIYFSVPISNALFGGNLFVTMLLPLIIFIEALNAILYNFFRTFQRMKIYSIFVFIGTYLGVIFAYFFVSAGYEINGAVIGLLLSKIILFLIMFGMIAVEVGVAIPAFRNLRNYLAFGLPLVPSGLSDWVINSSDRYVISIFLGTAYVGYYSPGYLLGNLIIMFIQPLGCVLPVALSKHYDEDKRDLVENILSRSLKYFLVLAVPAAFGLSLLSKPILSILSTPEIAQEGYMVTPFVALGMLFYGTTSIIANIISLVKRTKISASIWFMAAVLNLGLSLLLVPRLGIIGAAAATMIAFAAALILVGYYSVRIMRIATDYKFILKCIMASLIMSSIIILISPLTLLQILVTIGICAAIYFLLLWLFRGITAEEVNFLKDVFKKNG
jgi:O-antigen/teichoic acid export membrane protein